MDSWDYAGYWNAHAREYGPLLAVTHMSPDEYQAYYRPILARLAPARVRSVADVGCGSAMIRPLLRELYPQALYDGYDVSAVMLGYARPQVTAPDALFLMEGSHRLAGAYDFILCHSVLTHVTRADAGDLLDAIRASLTPAGRASISIHINAAAGMVGDIKRVDYAPAYFEDMLLEHSLNVVDYVDGIQRYYAVERA